MRRFMVVAPIRIIDGHFEGTELQNGYKCPISSLVEACSVLDWVDDKYKKQEPIVEPVRTYIFLTPGRLVDTGR